MEPRRAAGKGGAAGRPEDTLPFGRTLWHPRAMSSVRSCFALALAVSLCAAAAGCGSNAGSGAGGGTTGTTSSMTSSGTGGDPTVGQCESCLDTKCSAEKTACGPDCYAIQACLDAVCAHLSQTGSSTEGDCQVYCQTLHPNGKAPHLAYVNCVSGAACEPPCAGAPYDYDQCVAAQTAGACKAASDACNASSDCTMYKACAATCATFADCQKCGTGTSGAAGEKLYEAYTLCFDQSCLATYWLPNI